MLSRILLGTSKPAFDHNQILNNKALHNHNQHQNEEKVEDDDLSSIYTDLDQVVQQLLTGNTRNNVNWSDESLYPLIDPLEVLLISTLMRFWFLLQNQAT